MRLAAEGHAERANLLGLDLVLGAAVELGHLTLVACQLVGDPGHVLLGDGHVVAIEGLALHQVSIGREQNLNSASHVRRMDFLASLGALDSLAPKNGADEIKPTTCSGRVREAVDAGRAKGADRPALPEAVAMN